MLNVFVGDDPFLVEEAISTAKAKHDQWQTLEGQFESAALADALQNLTFFSSQNILVLNPWFLVKTVEDAAIPELQALLTLAAKSTDIEVIIGCTAKVDQRKKLVTWLKKLSPFQSLTGFKDWEEDKVIAWIQARASSQEKKLTFQGARQLFELGGTNLRFLASEVDKLVVYVGLSSEITPKDIDTASLGASGRIFQLTESLKTRNLSGAIQSLDRLFDAQEDPVKILGLIVSTLRLYLQISLGLSAKISPQDIAQRLGKNPYFIKQLLPSVQKNYTLPQLKALYNLLCSCDLEIKTGRQSGKSAVESLVIKICQ